MRGWSVERKGSNVYMVRHGKDSLLLTGERTGTICEWKQWEKYYLPDFSLEGKTVLDVGAGCGETAYFFFEHGAKEVIAVEVDPIQVGLLKENSEQNGWTSANRSMKIIPRAFEVGDLATEKFDFAKIDIEGGEVDLLQLDRMDLPLVLEAHGKEMRDKLRQKFGLSVLVKALPLEDVWLLGNRPLQPKVL